MTVNKMEVRMRQYSNFDEIERDLKLLKLQQDIAKEEISLNIHRTKESLTPKAMAKKVAGSLLKSAMVLKTADKILSLISKKKSPRRTP